MQIRLVSNAVILAISSILTIAPYHLSAEENQPEWGYGGTANPTKWNELSPDFEACEVGRNQSPININFVEENKEAKIEFDYQSSAAKVIDNGHTIEVTFEPGNSVNINGETYELLQFHFHTPSEHRFENESSPMELHFVHQNQAGELAVVGVMMKAGDENAEITSIWNAIPTANKAEKGSQITFNPDQLLPKDKASINYSGSLTTPPCSEQVSWNLLLEPIELSVQQIETFESFYPYNARPIQPVNGRIIYSDE